MFNISYKGTIYQVLIIGGLREISVLSSGKQKVKKNFKQKSHKNCDHFHPFIQSYVIKLVLADTSFFMSSLNLA